MRVMNYQLLTLLVLVSLASGCSWFGGSDDNTLESTRNAAMDTQSNTAPDWYCYGNAERDWDCSQQPQPGKITVINARAGSAEPAPPPAVPASGITAARMPAPTPAPAEKDPVTLLELPEDHYAVQLIAMQDVTRVKEYASSNGIENPIIVTTRDQGRDWHVLLLGTYDELENAEQAKREWEGTRLLKVKPWIRKLGPLQESMRVAQAQG